MDKISPRAGKAMMSMIYYPGVNGVYNGVEGASHLFARTTEPMRVGQLYEISFWTFVQSGKRYDPDWGKHLGIAILPQNLSFFIGEQRKSLIIPFMGVDTLEYDHWYQVKWRVRPLCTSNYLMIGVFADPQWPRSHSYADIHYFVDNVAVVAMPDTSAVADKAIYYCSRYDPVALGISPLMDPIMLVYENDAFALTLAHQAVLDSFATYVKQFPDLVFELSGHTDSIGKDNLALSQKRVQAVYYYLTEVLKIPSYRFYTLASAGTAPYRPNHTAEGRALNRRTEIKQSNRTLAGMFYQYALKAVSENNKPAAYAYLDKWLAKEDEDALMLLLFDPRFDPLRADKRWPLLEKKVRDSYKGFKYARESFLIDSLRFDACRVAGGELTTKLNSIPAQLPGEVDYDVVLPYASETTVRRQYEANFQTLLPLLKKTGWMRKGDFSESARYNGFHLLMGADDFVELLNWLPDLQKACEAGELPWIAYARCYDRSRLLMHKPQRYLLGYQILEDGSVELPEWEGDENTVNDARAKIGLPLLPPAVVEAMRMKKRP